MKTEKKAYVLEELTLLYVTVDGVMSFTVVPTKLASKVKDKKFERNKPMVQLSLLGDVGEREYFSGNCMQNGSSCFAFVCTDQKVNEREDGTEIVTVFKNGKGQTFEHHVFKPHGVNALALHNELINDGDDITVEMIASASIGAITPFCEQNNADNLKTYRMKSCWSGEGRLNVIPATDLQLEDAWSSYGIRQDRIGQVGSMPCRKYLPFYAVEDTENACVWAMSIEAPMSWQIDALHHLGAISLTGGIADFSSGHFRKILKKGERFTTHEGFVTAVNGDFDTACAALQEMYAHRLKVPASEESLPIIYNEYCWSWGNPDLEKMKPVIDECARLGVGIFVVDCGWWLTEGDSWYTLGDWNVNKKAFPKGIRECADLIKSKGMIPGVWFEFEALSTDSQLFKEHRDWCLTRDGHTVINRERALLDFRKPEVRAYATEKTIDFLRENGFGYMKLDYNEGLGIGCDGAESYGEGMRQHIECVIAFLQEIKHALPNLIIEICSSGGHRLEPLFLSIGAQASFSDEHLDADGALIAADLQRYMLPRQMQVWATLEPAYDIERTYFTLVKGMTGRFCLSGNLCALSAAQKKAMEQSVPFYNKIKPIIKNGVTRINAEQGITSYKHPKGLRYVIRFSPDASQAVLWLFNFGKGKSACVMNEVLADYEILDSYAYGKVEKKGIGITVTQPKANELLGAAVLLRKKQ